MIKFHITGATMRLSRRLGVLPCWLAMLLGFTPSASLSAQGGRASISGVITDATGSLVPDATVVATNTATGVSLNATSNEIGAYVLPLVPVGTYAISFKKAGFKTE